MDSHEMRFSGIERLYGRKAWQQIHRTHAAVIGIGGVGSWAAEALARSGIQKITLIDLDDICITNTNRQVHTLHATIGLPKVTAMAQRLSAINPEMQVETIQDFFTAQTAVALLQQNFDVVIDAIDSLQNKCLLIASCLQRGIPLVTVGGAGGRSDPSQIRIADLYLSQGDALLRKTRRVLRTRYQFPTHGPVGIPSVFSMEAPVFPGADGEVCVQREEGVNLRLDCESGYGTASFVTGSFGFAAASAALRILAAKAERASVNLAE